MANTNNPYLSSGTKRSLDIAVASAALPVYLAGFGFSALTSPSQPTSSHDRVTADGNELTIKKFNFARFKRLGEKLVALGFDETPQVTCILQGSMSIVGPRALRNSDMDAFLGGLNRTLRHGWLEALAGVKPGIMSTYALAEHGRMNDKDRAVMDIYDAQHASLRHDLFLLRHIGRMPTQSIVVALGDSVDDPALISEEPAIREFFDLEAEVHLHNEDEGEVVA